VTAILKNWSDKGQIQLTKGISIAKMVEFPVDKSNYFLRPCDMSEMCADQQRLWEITTPRYVLEKVNPIKRHRLKCEAELTCICGFLTKLEDKPGISIMAD